MIDVLLPIYNGEKYLDQQLKSLFNQTFSDWRVLVRDDGSNDNSPYIIEQYEKKYPDRIIVIRDMLGNLGPSGCYNLLLQHVTSDYFMFCDQDDIWKPEKIEKSFSVMLEMEKENHDAPILVCSDASCIDEENKQIFPSFFQKQKFTNVTDNVHKMLALNVVQGSTALMNIKVKNVIKFIPAGLYHDWWTAVNVAYYGKVGYIHEPLLAYRQHNNNVVGAVNIGFNYLLEKTVHLKRQLGVYVLMYKSLAFKPSIVLWIYYKIILNLKRI